VESELDDNKDDNKENEEGLPMFHQTEKLFVFRSSVNVSKGKAQGHTVKKAQYEFPFTVTIPPSSPSSFQFIDSCGNNY
jgi:hypothetical protein